MKKILGGLVAFLTLIAGLALAQSVVNYVEQGGARTVVGGSLDVVSGGDLDIESGGALKIAGTTITSSAAELNILDGVTATAAEINQHTDESAMVETVTATNVITAGESGKTFFLSSATEFASTLPAPAAGLWFKFVVAAAPSGASYTIATAASANIIIGGINELEVDTADDGPYSAVGDLVSFVDGVAVVGDFVEMISDGTSWYIFGQTQADGGITIGST
jgi:hypothetical protein